jgi:RNA polymerase sigma-70 factor (ECF subfamily)
VTEAEFDTILAAAREGSEWAWGVLVSDVGPGLVGFFRARGVPDPEALTGDVFVDLARNLRTFNGDRAGFRSWVFVIAYRRMADDWRKRSRRPEETPSGLATEAAGVAPSAEDEVIGSHETATAFRVLQVLTEDQRDVITLRVVVGLTLGETAEVLGKPVGAVKALQRRAVASLRKEILRQAVSQ